MSKKRRPTLISALLLSGTIALAGGTAALAVNPVSNMMTGASSQRVPMQPLISARLEADSSALATPTAAPTSSASTAPGSAPSAASAAPLPRATAKKSAASAKSGAKVVTYTVKRGDTLANIAAWFHQHGFGAIYEANRAVIGSNPNLIFPGQKITVSGSTMTVENPK